MRKNIIQSKTEPNKNDIWLSEEGLKKYGKNGWEPLGDNSNNSGGSEPVIIEYPLDSNETITITDEQIEATKNSNVKIKLVDTSINIIIICMPIAYAITNYEGSIFVRISTDGTMKDISFVLDFTNKTIHLQM